MQFDSSVMRFQGVARMEQLGLGAVLPAKGYRLIYELFHLSCLSESF